MKYVNRDLKGTYGYIKKQTIFELIKTIVLFAMALGIFFMGLYTLHTKKSLWSIIAVLALLPACKSLVGLIMFLRYRSLPEADHERYMKATKGVSTLFENIITTSDYTFFIPVIVVAHQSVICYCDKAQKNTDDLKKHLDNVLKNAGHKYTVKIFDSEDAFIERAGQIKELSGDDKDLSGAVITTLKAVSL